MKGIVVEINKNDAVILTDDGIFTKVKNKNYAVGQTANIQVSRKAYSKLIAGAASMAAAFALCTIGAYAWFTPTDYVSMDVNPSLEYTLNTFDRILEVKGVNDDGEEILESLDLRNMTIEDAVKKTLDKLIADGYLTDDPNGGVVITTSNDEMGDAEQLAAELEQDIQAYLNSKESVTAEVDAEAVALERVEAAKELGVTPGKLNLVEKLQASTTGAISVEEWLTKSVKEINKEIKANRKAGKGDWESDDRPDSEEAVTEDGIKLNGKPEKPDKSRSNGKDLTDGRDAETAGEIRWNDQDSEAYGDREKGKPDSSQEQKITRPDKDDQKSDGNSPDKTQKNDSGQGNSNSSDKDSDRND